MHEADRVALGLSPELLHQSEGKVPSLGCENPAALLDPEEVGHGKGILALPCSQCLKLPCIVCQC